MLTDRTQSRNLRRDPEWMAMELNRREFVLLAATTACASCGSGGGASNASALPVERVVDAGPALLYDADGVYDRFRHQGFFLVRRSGKLVALSSDCTHRDCPLRALADQTLSCKCHGSRFDLAGNVLRGPAQRNLPQFVTAVDANQHLIVQVTRGKFDEE
jgi:Rieske Fe-S protein